MITKILQRMSLTFSQMSPKRSSRCQLLVHVAVGFTILYTKDLHADAQPEPSAPPPTMPLPTTIITQPPPPPSSPTPQSHSGRCISFNRICHGNITLEVRTIATWNEFP